MARLNKLILICAITIVCSSLNTFTSKAWAIGDCDHRLEGDCFTSWYAGLGVGAATLDSDILSAALFIFDDSANSYSVVGGYRFNKYFAFEASGTYSGVYNYFLPFIPISVEAINIGVGGNLYLPIGEFVLNPNLNFVSFLLKGGIHYWDATAEADTTGVTVYSDDGIDLFYGYGLNVDVARHLAVRAEYTIYNLDSDTTVDNTSMKLLFKF